MIVITRPLPEAHEYVKELEALGHETLLAPMLAMRHVDFEAPDLKDYEAVVFTSATGVRFFDVEAKGAAYCVGEHTEAAAREAGFDPVYSAEGTGADLVNYIIEIARTSDFQKPFLHVRGRDAARALDEDLKAEGLLAERLVVYKADFIDELPGGVVQAFEEKRIRGVTFFSKRTLENFLRLAELKGFTESLSSVKALCISQNVLECVRPELWAGTYSAETPDRDGMRALLESKLDQKIGRGHTMSTSNKSGIENATQVIERFGGIRPMAKKMDVAVTTVQGWKKRDVIPGTRREQVLEAAAAHDVDLSDVLEGAEVANQNDKEEEKAAASEQAPQVAQETPKEEPVEKAAPSQIAADPLDRKLAVTEKRAIARSTWINLGLLIIGLGALAVLMWPQKGGDSQNGERLSALEENVDQIQGEVNAVKEKQSFFGTLIPEDLGAQLDSLREQAGQAQEQIGQALEKAQQISDDVLAEDAGNIEQRLTKLEEHVSEITGSPVLAGLLGKFEGMSADVDGQLKLDQTMQELGALVSTLGATEEGSDEPGLWENTLDAARTRSDAMGETFEDVPATDLKAAALLLGMSQFRSSLDRDNEAFEQDLQVLMGLVGEEDVELRAALEKLAPHAESGVLTPSGLSSEFKGLAGDAVVASLTGEDVTLQDRAKARFNELFQVEKDGELLTGTDTQATLAKTESLLDQGDLEGAIAEAETLDGDAAQIMAPWLEQARISALAQRVKDMMGDAMNVKAYGSNKASGGITAGGYRSSSSVNQGSSGLIRNEETGINIYKPSRKLGISDSVKDANPFSQ